MWTIEREQVKGQPAYRVRLFQDGKQATYALFIRSLIRSDEFRAFFSLTLQEIPFGAYFWETPPVTRRSYDRLFEFVATECSALFNLQPDVTTFAQKFLAAGPASEVAMFPSLGGDTLLIAPCPRGAPESCTHLATFVRSAPASQQHALWRAVGTSVDERISERPIWLSTSGLGVSWLHVRIDIRPKYYSFVPYREEAVPHG